MRVLTTALLAAFIVSVSALPSPPPPHSFLRPPLYAFKNSAVDVATDVEPKAQIKKESPPDDFEDFPRIESRDEAPVDNSEAFPNVQARSEQDLGSQLDVEVEARAEDLRDPGVPILGTRSEEIQPASEFNNRAEPLQDDGALPDTQSRSLEPPGTGSQQPQIQARRAPHSPIKTRRDAHNDVDNHWLAPGVSTEDEQKYKDNLAKLAAGNCGQGCHDSINSFQSRNSKANNGYPPVITAADEKKYKDNLAKLAAGDCGQGCHDSIASFQSRNSKIKNGYYDHHDVNNDNYDFHTVSRSVLHDPVDTNDRHGSGLSRAERGERNTVFDDQKYQENLAKQRNHACGQGCLDSINSYLSVGSLQSQQRKLDEINNKDYHDRQRQYNKEGVGYTTLPDGKKIIHNTPADDLKHEINHVKEDFHQCGQGCMDSQNHYHHIAHEDHVRHEKSINSKKSKSNSKNPH
ncbi:hypothetical protein C8035_v006969 [Colletotrichum spinosum]|uniref:Uncharacterized protein n=1 Tax=Colletotrichum spinosum TaxID=1347390 RepID=A0A4V3HSX4_9PEZI|nr:hypothetical protein C8035_v006969 [Colletotrichum spinosum]